MTICVHSAEELGVWPKDMAFWKPVAEYIRQV